ncbi:MAG: HAMP domain-containing histidine kinase [Bacteroidota bacterium]|nr:HAMP domain-containing histidine kinase [Bacteroidota bacterium]
MGNRKSQLVKELEKCSQELKHKNQQLIRINKELDNFVYAVSLDLKSPILNVEGLINALRAEISSDTKEAGYIIDLMNLSLNKFKSTVEDLSEIAQVNKNEEEEYYIECEALFEDIKFIIHDDIIKYGTIIEADFSKAPFIYFSRTGLKSIFLNLITNSLKFSTPLRRPEIYFGSHVENEYTVVTVKDNGLGIKSDDLEKIFLAFKRMYTHVSGSGVGLYIVKRMVEGKEGKIEVNSIINKGSTFRIFIKNK